MPTTEEFDNVNNPKHYIYGPECIDAMCLMYGAQMVIAFCICNAFKYFWRHRNKNGLEDLQKAQWYLNKSFDLNMKYIRDYDEYYFQNYDHMISNMMKFVDDAIKNYEG